MSTTNRIYNEIISVEKKSVKIFFNKRAPKKNSTYNKNSTMLQDQNPDIALKRDAVEKKVIFPYFSDIRNSKILDIGCGIGRWAESFINADVEKYVGIDISEDLIEVAKEEYKDYPYMNFFAEDPIEFFKDDEL